MKQILESKKNSENLKFHFEVLGIFGEARLGGKRSCPDGYPLSGMGTRHRWITRHGWGAKIVDGIPDCGWDTRLWMVYQVGYQSASPPRSHLTPLDGMKD